MGIIGHDRTVGDMERLAGSGALGHGYILSGPSMVGKRTIAQAFGKFLEKGRFEAPTENEVLQDLKMIDSSFVRMLDPDARGESIGIDAVREIKGFLWQRPNVSSRRTVIVDNADTLTTEAQNALLKMTEEPPASSLLLLVTSDPDAILGTIRSRLPEVYFGTVPGSAIQEWLAGTGDAAIADAASCAARARGKPGLAWRFMHDAQFRAELEQAERFLAAPAASRKDLIKKLIEPDDFSLRKFLEAITVVLASKDPAPAALWHKALRLSENAGNFPLNPRLQLEALMR